MCEMKLLLLFMPVCKRFLLRIYGDVCRCGFVLNIAHAERPRNLVKFW